LQKPKGDETRSSLLFLDPTKKLHKSLLSIVADTILLKASMTMTKAGGYKITLSQAMRALKKAKGSSIIREVVVAL
jgi:hypothetical protein